MKRIIVFLTSFVWCYTTTYAQPASKNITEHLTTLKERGLSTDEIKEVLKGIIQDPDLYNELWKSFLDLQVVNDNSKFNFLKDLNIKFKTFQSDDTAITALGFSYDFKYDFARFRGTGTRRLHDFGITANGNVAFNKKLNPNDFLESRLHYTFSFFQGGVIENTDAEILDSLNKIDDKLAAMKDPHSPEALKLWKKHGEILRLTNQFYYSIAPKFALESNQDFSKEQFTPGIIIGVGAKGWNTESVLSKLNILDYPFALLRLLTGTDKRFTPYGSTLPTVQFQFDYVVPKDDVIRKGLVDNADPFPRFKFEAGFRTFISRIRKENIFFNADLRYYKELNAKSTIKNAAMDTHTYYVMALQSTTGMYVSYAKGKLPFDAKKDEVYSIGFNYKF
jgi:hypothetical protein